MPRKKGIFLVYELVGGVKVSKSGAVNGIEVAFLSLAIVVLYFSMVNSKKMTHDQDVSLLTG